MKMTIALMGLAIMLSINTASAATTAPAAATTATTTMAKPAATTAAKTPVPCGDMSKQVDEALKGAKLSPDKLKVATQHAKAGNDLCKVKKDAAADSEFSKVMKMLKKS